MRKESNNQVSGISNFARNLGGAVGTSFLVAFLTRHRQTSRVDLVSHLHKGDIFFDCYFKSLEQAALRSGTRLATAGHQSLAQLQQIVDAQANVLAYISAFFVLGMIVAFLSRCRFS